MKSLDDFPTWALKVVGILIIFLLSMIFGSLPLKLQRDVTNVAGNPTRNLLISLSNCFAGGVFFSTVVLDMFPDVQEIMNDALASVNIETTFPLGYFMVGFGFIFMLILEQLVESCCENSWLNHGHSHGENNVFENTPDETRHLLEDDLEPDVIIRGDVHAGPVNLKKSVTLGESTVLSGNSISYTDSDNEDQQDKKSYASSGSYETFYSERGTHHRVRRLKSTKSLASVQSVSTSNFRTYMLVFAISLHSIFEGLSVGLLTKVQVLLQILLALIIHKSIIAFSIGVQLVDADLPTKVVLICLMIFAFMAPLGVGIGLVLLGSLNAVAKLFISGILQGIATGTFLYVTFFEVLPHELNIVDDKKLLKIFFVLFGYFLITGICYFENRFHTAKHISPNHNTTTFELF